MDSDPDAAFSRSLQERNDLEVPVFDADVRIVVVVKPHQLHHRGRWLDPSGDGGAHRTVAKADTDD
jgi:hypothetical protein